MKIAVPIRRGWAHRLGTASKRGFHPGATLLGFIASVLIAGCAAPGANVHAPSGGWGKYVGPIRVQWEPGRKMRLLEDTHYIAPNGVDWFAPKGWEVDGASIPKAFWCTVGGPYEDYYRDASVYHDVACDQRQARWQDVHLMFYTAMRCSGVETEKAKILYAAVYRFGPRWPDPTQPRGPMMEAAAVTPRQPSPSEAQELENWVRRNNPSLKEIEQTRAAPGRPGN